MAVAIGEGRPSLERAIRVDGIGIRETSSMRGETR
jgi:hypothetical protein